MKIKILGIFVCLMLISAVPSVLSVHLANEYNLTGKNIAMKGGVTNVENNVDDIGWYTSLALDENGFPHISYYDYTNGDLKYACFNGIDWSTEVVDSTGNVGRYTSLALDENGFPHISYYDYTNGDLKYAYFTGSRWNTETIDSWGDVGLYTSVALDSHNYPHISYCDYSKRTLKYAHWTGTTWKKTVVDKTAIIAAGEYFGDYTSIAVDSQDFPHISYCDIENYDLKYAHYSEGNWKKEIVDSNGNVGVYSSIVLDDSGNPHISYVYWSGFSLAFDLKYAQKKDGSWNIETVDEEGDVRKWTSLALDSNGMPHISYYDYTEGALKYTFFTGENWHKEFVETEGSTGCFNSICLNTDGKPFISYYDWGNKALKYASTTEGDWSIKTVEMDTNNDYIDQQQIYCSGYSLAVAEEEPLAQSFIPNYSVLTRVELMLVKRYDPGGFSVSIREKLSGEDLTSIYLSPDEIPEDIAWKTFDFQDINVNPGQTYYIVCSSENTEEYNMYYWYFGHNDPYPNGHGWVFDHEWEIIELSVFPDLDMGFKTFGLNTEIPSTPIIDGPSSGKIGVEYEYNFTAIDPDGDDVCYIVEWDETNSGTFGPHKSGETVTLTHSWSRRGNYVIRAKAVDSYGAESDWATLSISMPKNKIINPFERFLDNHPNMFPILRYLLEL